VLLATASSGFKEGALREGGGKDLKRGNADREKDHVWSEKKGMDADTDEGKENDSTPTTTIEGGGKKRGMLA